jgi:hypothetical protein
MIPFLDKTIVKLVLVLAIISAIGFGLQFTYDAIFQAGVNSVTAAVNETAVTVLEGNVENSNEDKIMLEKSTEEIERLKREIKRLNTGIPRVTPDPSCPIDKYRSVYEQAKFSAHSE